MNHLFEQSHMGTRVTIAVYADEISVDLQKKIDEAFAIFTDLDHQFSLFRADSEIAFVNAQAGEWTQVTPRFFNAVASALEMQSLSGGTFDPFVHSGQIEIDRANSRLRLSDSAALDLNAVIKGLALDLAADRFDGETSVMIEAGGDIVVRGAPPDGMAWRVGIRDPANPTKIVTILPIESGAVCTSGEYFRGEHLRKTSPTSTTSFTVIAPSAQLADELSTAAYVMPSDQAVRFVEEQDASCLSIVNSGEVLLSAGMSDLFKQFVL